jgi:hypothetical protein
LIEARLDKSRRPTQKLLFFEKTKKDSLEKSKSSDQCLN